MAVEPAMRGLTRRAGLVAGLGAVAAGPTAASPQRAGARPTGLIDVHAHWLPAAYLAGLAAAGVSDVDGVPLPPWDEASHLELMDRHGIASSVLSISAPGLGFTGGATARDLARRINEEAAERRVRSHGRFGAFALLTLPDVEGALREMAYALDVLGLDGVGVYTNSAGVYLGDPRFEPILMEADRRGAVVYTHPVAPPGFGALSLGFPGATIEYPFDTTRMLLNLAAHGVLDRYRNMKLIASHGGGALPYLAHRVATMVSLYNPDARAATPAQVRDSLTRVFYDTTAVSNATSLASYYAFVPPERRLFGSDTPFMREATIAPALSALSTSSSGPDAAAVAAMAQGNADRLFPALAALRARGR